MIFHFDLIYNISKIKFKDAHSSFLWTTDSFTITFLNIKLIFYKIKSLTYKKKEFRTLNITYWCRHSGEPWPGGSTGVSKRDIEPQQSRKLMILSRLGGPLGVRRNGVSTGQFDTNLLSTYNSFFTLNSPLTLTQGKG